MFFNLMKQASQNRSTPTKIIKFKWILFSGNGLPPLTFFLLIYKSEDRTGVSKTPRPTPTIRKSVSAPFRFSLDKFIRALLLLLHPMGIISGYTTSVPLR